MIYLIRSAEYEPERGFYFSLKIGFTDNLESRMNHYKTNNRTFRLLKILPGDQLLETAIHKKFKQYQIETEWFEEAPEILDFFYSEPSTEELDKIKIEMLSTESEKQDQEMLRAYENCDEDLKEHFKNCFEISRTYDRLKYVCELSFQDRCLADRLVDSFPSWYSVVYYYKEAGPEICRAEGYNTTDIKLKIELIHSDISEIEKEVKTLYEVGKRYPRTEIKKTLQKLYDKYQYLAIAKAQDLENWYNIRAVNYMYNGKKTHGFKILSQK